jgi:hypothetical protein
MAEIKSQHILAGEIKRIRAGSINRGVIQSAWKTTAGVAWSKDFKTEIEEQIRGRSIMKCAAILLLGLQGGGLSQTNLCQLRRGKGLGRVCLCAGRHNALGRYP